MVYDSELLRRYAEAKSEEAFRELVQRHIDVVYAAALRQARGNAAMAEDITQSVFTDLARKADALKRHDILVGWLHTATRFAASKAIRAESRRRAREQEMYPMNDTLVAADERIDWDRVKPVLDEVVGELKERERVAILLRFFEQSTLAEVGARLSLSETAARSVVDRALERMRCLLARRGITSSATALGIALANQATFSAPVGLAVVVSSTAMAAGTTSTMAAGAATLMGMTKLQIVAAGVVALAGTATLLVQAHRAASIREELAAVHQQNAQASTIDAQTDELARALAETEALRARSGEVTSLRRQAAELRSKLGEMGTADTNRGSGGAPAFTGSFFEAGQVDVKPKARFQARPSYPLHLLRLGIAGRATIDFIVDGEGRVRNAKITDATHEALGEAALEAVREWEYEPAQKDGNAVAMRTQVPIYFTMAPKSTPTKEAPAATAQKSQATLPWF